MGTKKASKPETKGQKPTDQSAARPPRAPVNTSPRGPRPPRGPESRATPPPRARPAPEQTAAELEAAELRKEIESSHTLDTPYPMWPHLAKGAIDRVSVYRKVPKPGGGKGTDWQPINLPWQPGTLTWEQIGEICGGGNFAVLGTKNGKTVASYQDKAEGPPRTPGPADAAKLTLGSGEHANAIETPGGWISFPNLDPMYNVAFISMQQVAWGAREDANKANQAMATLLSQLIEHAFKPDPSYALLEQIIDGQRHKIDDLYKELREERTSKHKLEIESASKNDEESKMKIELYKKGMDVMDGAAGAAAMAVLGKGASGNSAADVGKALAQRFIEANQKQLAAKTPGAPGAPGAQGGGQ